ncbi:protein SLOW WALKER 2 [Euphorbia lathyris]|uniref:protein SLOW WALKER 2 n=1 Tax=Euphorbia lathyris TaxID=212925 RepID=UPI0033140A71
MAMSKPSKPSKHGAGESNNLELLKSDVASFASTLGLSSLPSSGFNDVDFRKSGTLKNPKPSKPKTLSNAEGSNNSEKPNKIQFDKRSQKSQNFNNRDKNSNRHEKNSKFDQNPNKKPVPKPPVLSLDENEKTNNNTTLFNKYKNLPKLPLVKASTLGMWHVDAMEFEKKVFGEGKSKLDLKMGTEEWKLVVEKKKQLGERLMWQYAQDYEQSRGKSGDIKMLVATQRSGTAADKVSAFSVLVGDNCVANLRSLDALLGMVTSKVGKRHALTGFEALKELFISSMLPDRKLKTLLQQPVDTLPETKDGYSLLLFWYWEDCLKTRYERFVFALEEASRDMLPILKDKALKTMYALLKSKSEQERRLLTGLVNKLGDPQNRGASNADFHLSNLLSDHPNMKAVVINEVDTLLFRPHLGLRAKYHAVNFLSQIRLSLKGDGPAVAKRLIDVYFALFKVLITEAESTRGKQRSGKGENRKASDPPKEHKMENSSESHVELDSRLLSALLTGVNRAFPFVSSTEADDIIEVQTPMLFRLVHSINFNVGVQALMLLDKISSKNQIVSDRFYRALYAKLLDPAAMNSSKAKMFIALVLRAMKSDVNLKRVTAFSKRLLQVSLQQPPQLACGCLFLLSEVLKARPPLWNMVMQNELADDDLEHFEDIVEEETDVKPHAEAKVETDLKFVQSSDKANPENNSSESEDDSPAPSSEDNSEDDSDEAEADEFLTEELTEVAPKEIQASQPQISSGGSSLPGGYDPRHREPSYCNADHSSWWELQVLASHVHPSVATMAGTILSGAHIVYNGNPLNDLSLTAFLDKLMEKKPRQTTWHGGSQIEPAKKLDMNNQLIGSEILSLAEEDVPPEDLVFHKFYANKMSSSKPKKKKKKAVEDEAAQEIFDVGDGGEEVGVDESDNEEIENMLDSADFSFEADGEYNYDDLDQVAKEDDDDLIGNTSDVEMDDDLEGIDDGGETDEDGVAVDIGDIDDASDEEDIIDDKKRKRKSGNKAGASPFASLEDYEHLLNENEESGKKKRKSRKKNEKEESGKKKQRNSEKKNESEESGKKKRRSGKKRKTSE